MRRLLALALVAAPVAFAVTPASAVDCSQYVYIYGFGAIRGQDLDCWYDYITTRGPVWQTTKPIIDSVWPG